MTFKGVILFVGLLTAFAGPQLYAQESVEDFIISVVSNYKNPMAYYPLRQDIFLPTEQELDSIERKRDFPEGAVVTGSFIFLKSDELDRDRFIDSNGNLIFKSNKYKGLSSNGGYTYRLRRHDLFLRKTDRLGQFLWSNQQFKKLNQQKAASTQ